MAERLIIIQPRGWAGCGCGQCRYAEMTQRNEREPTIFAVQNAKLQRADQIRGNVITEMERVAGTVQNIHNFRYSYL